jgi:hypothetical protein
MPKVICTVKNCAYWEEGNGCSADQILITDNHDARFDPDPEATKTAELAVHTACATFEKKE